MNAALRELSKSGKTPEAQRRNRSRAAGGALKNADVFVVSLVSSPGAGKTAFLEKTLTLLRQANYRPAAAGGRSGHR